MATHSSILAWEIPWTEQHGGLQSMGLQSDTTEQLSIHLFTYGNVYVSVLLSQFTLPHHHVQKCPRTSYFQPRFILGNMPYDMDHKQCASYLSSNPLSLIAWFLTSYLVPLNLDFLLKTGMIVFAFQDHLRAYDVRFTMCLVLCLLLLLLSHFSRVRLRATTQMAAHQA